MKQGKTLQEFAAELKRQAESKRDYIVDTRELKVLVESPGFGTGGTVTLGFRLEKDGRTHILQYEIGRVAHRQIAEWAKIPARYYNYMLENAPDLLAVNVMTWFQRRPARRMVRTLDGRVRAFLSDRYRRIDNYDVAEVVLSEIAQVPGLRVESCEITEERMYLKVVNPRLETEIKPGDTVQAGFMVTNSEVGLGALTVQPLLFRLVCRNGMVVNDFGHRRYHIGRQLFGDDWFVYEFFKDDTIAADDRAFLLKVRDTVRVVLDETVFRKVVEKAREAAGIEIPAVQPMVELTAKKYGLGEDEKDSVLNHLAQGGDLSLWGLASAVTRTAQDVASYDRSTELESIGWQILNDRKLLAEVAKQV